MSGLARAVVALTLSAGACSSEPEPVAPPPDVSVEREPVTITVGGEQPVVENPVSLEDVSRLLGLADLPLETQAGITATLNLSPAPCEPCRRTTLARCLADHPGACPNVDVLAERVRTLHQAGMTEREVRMEVVYDDLWFPGMAGEGTALSVVLWLDGGPFDGEAQARAKALSERFGDRIALSERKLADAPPEIKLRSAPAWFVGGYRLRGHRSEANLVKTIERELRYR